MWTVRICIAMLVLLGCGEHKTAGDHPPDGTEADRFRPARIVLITTSESCPCTLEECRELETHLSEAVEGRSIPIQKTDYALDWPQANTLLNTYGLQFVPAVVVLDAKDRALFKADGYVDLAALSSALAQGGP